jgi:hypothetical protein
MKALKPTKLLGNWKPKYRDCGNKPLEHFQRGYDELKEISKAVYHTITGSSNSKAMEIPYRVAFLIARAGKSHTI